MTLTKLLEIDLKLLQPEDLGGLRTAETLWQRAGSPVETRELCDTLENILQTCQREGILYPKIILRRKRELQRGTWLPRAETDARESAKEAPPTPRARDASACTDCAGDGFVATAKGTGDLCRTCMGTGKLSPSVTHENTHTQEAANA